MGFANNPAANCEANGGLTSSGGGQGGTGSGTTALTGQQCTTRALTGEPGFGPTINGQLNTGSPPNVFYAGGQGGDSGCFPFTAPTPGCAAGDIGGLGGAGGSSARVGEVGIPRQSSPACQPTLGVVQTLAQPSPVPIVMIPPIQVQSAGSGGGGGGDHLDAASPVPNADDQGAGGGGGGGGIRISCAGAYSQGSMSTPGTILATGSLGGNTQQGAFSGSGGSGGGGEVWIQTFAAVTITSTSVINVDGPPRILPSQGSIGCSNQAAGGGGDGLIQLEAAQGPVPTASFNVLPAPGGSSGAVFVGLQLAGGGLITGHAESDLFVAEPGPNYSTPTELFNLGNAQGATLTIRYEGYQEAVNSSPQVPVIDAATFKSMATGGGPITAANIDELDGYRFIRFVADVSFPAPPATLPTAILPSVDRITISYTTSICP
jgi:hypothetical protein